MDDINSIGPVLVTIWKIAAIGAASMGFVSACAAKRARVRAYGKGGGRR
jgi:hypothetical protein